MIKFVISSMADWKPGDSCLAVVDDIDRVEKEVQRIVVDRVLLGGKLHTRPIYVYSVSSAEYLKYTADIAIQGDVFGVEEGE